MHKLNATWLKENHGKHLKAEIKSRNHEKDLQAAEGIVIKDERETPLCRSALQQNRIVLLILCTNSASHLRWNLFFHKIQSTFCCLMRIYN
jgi:hypothetical protein